MTLEDLKKSTESCLGDLARIIQIVREDKELSKKNQADFISVAKKVESFYLKKLNGLIHPSCRSCYTHIREGTNDKCSTCLDFCNFIPKTDYNLPSKKLKKKHK